MAKARTPTALHELQEAGRQQSLRRHENEPKLAGRDLLLDLPHRPRRHAAVQRRRRIAAGAQAVDLVLHQGDQRRDDDVHPLRQLGGHLVAQRLAAAGRHHHQRIPLFQSRPNRLLLDGSQRAEAPVTADDRQDVVE